MTYKVLHLELTSKCNLKCIHCRLQLDEYEAKNKYLEYQTIIDLLHETKSDGNMSLNLQGTGEASLHKDFLSIIQEAKKLNYKVITTTNLVAKSKNEYKKFMDNGLSKLTVSIDTLNLDLIPKTRTGTNIERLKENFKFLAKYYSSKMHVFTVVSDLTIQFIDEIYFFLRENNITTWQFIYLNNWDGTEGISKKNQKVLFDKITIWRNESNININLPKKESYCNQPYDILHINALGYIMPCCLYEDNNDINFGNIYKGSALEQFNSKEFNNFREEMICGTAEICKSCNLFKKYPVNS